MSCQFLGGVGWGRFQRRSKGVSEGKEITVEPQYLTDESRTNALDHHSQCATPFRHAASLCNLVVSHPAAGGPARIINYVGSRCDRDISRHRARLDTLCNDPLDVRLEALVSCGRDRAKPPRRHECEIGERNAKADGVCWGDKVDEGVFWNR